MVNPSKIRKQRDEHMSQKTRPNIIPFITKFLIDKEIMVWKSQKSAEDYAFLISQESSPQSRQNRNTHIFVEETEEKWAESDGRRSKCFRGN